MNRRVEMSTGAGVLGIAVIVFALGVAGAQAAHIIKDNFDGYPADSNIVGQGSWDTWDLTGDPLLGGFVRTTPSVSPEHSLEIGKPGNFTDIVWQLSGLTSGTYTFTASTYVPSSSDTGWSDLNVLNHHPAPFDWIGTMRFDFAAGAVSPFGVAGASVTLINDTWIEARIDVDVDNLTSNFYYNGEIISNPAGHAWTGNPEFAAINIYSEQGAPPMYYDDFLIVPEPATLAMLSLCGLAMLNRKRNK